MRSSVEFTDTKSRTTILQQCGSNSVIHFPHPPPLPSFGSTDKDKTLYAFSYQAVNEFYPDSVYDTLPLRTVNEFPLNVDTKYWVNLHVTTPEQWIYDYGWGFRLPRSSKRDTVQLPPDLQDCSKHHSSPLGLAKAAFARKHN